MPIWRSITVALAVGAALTAVPSGAPAAASPPGYQRVVDDTGTIAVSVPASWRVDSTAPIEGSYGDGIPRPYIGAGDPVENWFEPGMYLIVHPYSGPVERWDPNACDPLQGECDGLVAEQPYDDGDFAGWRQLIEACCGGGFYERVLAAAHDRSFTFQLVFSYGQTREPAEVEIFETILTSVAPAGASLPAPTTTGTADFPFASFHDVPQFGSEPVRGSGCGSAGQLGDAIPDGWWAGFATFAAGNNVDIDVVCVFSGAAAQSVARRGHGDDPFR